MNKLFTKIAKAFLGLSMAIGVGVAVSSASKDIKPVEAASATWNKITSTPVSGTKYLILSSDAKQLFDSSTSTIDSTSNHVALTGTSSSTTSITGDYDSKAWDFTLSGSTWYISRTLSSTTTYIGRSTNSNGITTATSTGSTVANTITNNSGAYTIKGSASRYLSYNTSSGRFRYFASGTVMLFEKAASPQTISGATSAYTDETVTLSSNASSTVTWSIVTADTDAAGAAVTSGGVVSVTGAGTVKVKAVASGYADATHTITFSVRPAGTYYDVTFDSNGGSSSPAKQSIKENATFTFPSPGTKTHYSFDGWSSDGGSTLYDEGDTSPAVVDDIEYTAYWTEDAKYTVTYVAGDHGTGSNYVVSNQYAGSYKLATFTTAGFTASSGYSFIKWSVGGVEYAEGASITISGNTTVTAIYAEAVDYSLFSGVLVEGDYVIYDATSGVALKNELASNTNYIGYTTVSPVSNKFTNPDASLVWHIGASATSGYWTIYNSTVDKYAASTGAKNKGQLLSDGTDAKSLWSCSSTSSSTTYDFVNKQNNTSGVNDTLRYNSGYGFACYSTGTGHVLTLYKAPSNVLDSVTTSGQTTSFTAGNTFSYGGTLTAHYTLEDDATVTPTSFKYGGSGIDPTTAGTSITTSTTLTKAEHDGKYIYVIYTENDITKYCSYQITVDYAAVTSVEIGTHSAEIGLNETYDDYLNLDKVSVTINSQYANQGYEWIVSATTVGDDYAFDESGLLSGDTEGTITLRCRSTADNSKYDELVVTVTGDPTAEFTPASVSGYVGKSDDIAFTYGNMSDTSLISITSSNSSIAEVGEFVADEGEGLVTVNFVAAGSATLSISYNGGSTLDTVDVTVSADSVTSVTWSASNIDVFSGDTLSTTGWNVQYEMASGDTGSAANYTIKLGSATVTAGYSFVGADNGKTMHVEYGGVFSSSINVVVTQRINDVYADIIDETEWSHELTAKTWSAVGDQTINGKSWTVAGEDDGTGYAGWDNTKGQQFGSGSHPYESLTLSSSDFSGTVSTVKITTSGASSINATVSVSVGGTAFKSSGNESVSISATSTEYTFTGVGSGAITISWANSSSKAIYFKALGVTTQTSSGTTPIANNASHKAAQRAAVAFAQAFNAAMDETKNCTEGLDDAWATCSSAYTSFKSAAAALGETEEAWALNLVKYATRVYSDDSAEACLERMMKTYEICVQKHGKTAFMSDLVTLGAPQVSPLVNIIGENTNSIAIIVIISMVSMTAIGGYFFLRKRKENQ